MSYFRTEKMDIGGSLVNREKQPGILKVLFTHYMKCMRDRYSRQSRLFGSFQFSLHSTYLSFQDPKRKQQAPGERTKPFKWGGRQLLLHVVAAWSSDSHFSFNQRGFYLLTSSASIISMQISRPQCPVHLPLMIKAFYKTHGYGALETWLTQLRKKSLI